MGNQFFQKWEITDIPNVRYDIDNIAWTSAGLTFTIISDESSPKKSFQLIWEASSVICYHVTDETYRSDCWELDFQKNGRFFETKSSKYIDEIREKSPLFPEEVIHFTIVGTNTIVDLIAKSYPAIKNE